MKEPVRILSDLHLGNRLSRIAAVGQLRPLLEGAGTVVFNGDTWQEIAPVFYERSREMLEELRALCADVGCAAVFLPGNHDPGWEGTGWLELAEGRIVVTHGDALLAGGAPWKREILLGGDAVRAAWQRHPAAVRDAAERHRVAREISIALPTERHQMGRGFWQRAWNAMIPPERGMQMIAAWALQGAHGAEFCERYFPQAELLVTGHFHRHGSWLCDGRRVLNTGSFVNPGRAMWVEWHDGWLSRGFVEESAAAFRPGPTVDLWRLEKFTQGLSR
jgi:UDP-2,3-diacylglucosamine pyrophosphatase LpxH